jgi:arylsulfatase
VPEWVAVDVRNRSHAISVIVEIPDGVVPSGTLLALGCALGGWSLHVLEGRLRYVHNLHGLRLYEVLSDTTLAPGRHHLEFRFYKDEGAGGRAAFFVDGRQAGEAELERFTPVAFNEVGIGLTCGYEWGPSVGGDYEAPFPFVGTIVRAEVSVAGPVVHDPVAEVAAILASQ